jgi:hypothetical protein
VSPKQMYFLLKRLPATESLKNWVNFGNLSNQTNFWGLANIDVETFVDLSIRIFFSDF